MPQPLPVHSLHSIPGGDAGVRTTLQTMRHIVAAWKTAPRIRQLAMDITRQCGGDAMCEVQTLHRYVRDRIRFVRDVADVETLHTPELTLSNGAGDCDDQSILLASLLESIGHRTRFVAVDTGNPPRYSHVYTEVMMPTPPHAWLPAETTEPWALGDGPRFVRRRMVQR